jgi:O-antigen/teichoic acid export membrane protein
MEENNKRIAKNTVYLYIRQLIMMLLSFVTTRVVLEKLGVSDYGVYSLVGGFVAGFAVLNNILSSSTRRFLALAIGKNERENISATFSTALTIHVIIAFLVALALETGGLWFMNSQLNIEPSRLWAANWVFQLSVIGTSVGVVVTPYMAAVTAHEHFKVYATFSIYDVVAKLVVIYLLVMIPGDKLIVYASLLLLVGLIGTGLYVGYCMRHFEECRFSLKIDKPLAREMLSFSGWGAFGHVITVVNGQGISIVLNIFYNTVMNAARGLAGTINFVISNFIAGFLAAAQPQLVKYYGQGDMQAFVRLIFNVTQYTLFILALMVVPVMLELDYVVGLWLGGQVPPYTCTFAKITLFCGLVYRSNSMVEDGLHAIGRIKENTLYSTPMYLLSIPLVYFSLKFDFGPVVAYWVGAVPPLLSFIANMVLLSKYTIFPGMKFFTTIFLKNVGLVLLSAIFPFIIQRLMMPGLCRFLVVCIASEISTFTVIWFLGLNSTVRGMVKEKLEQRLSRIFNR